MLILLHVFRFLQFYTNATNTFGKNYLNYLRNCKSVKDG